MAADGRADVLVIGSGATGAIASLVLAQRRPEGGLPRAGRLDRAGTTTRITAATGNGSGGRAGTPTSTSAGIPTTIPSTATPRRS